MEINWSFSLDPGCFLNIPGYTRFPKKKQVSIGQLRFPRPKPTMSKWGQIRWLLHLARMDESKQDEFICKKETLWKQNKVSGPTCLIMKDSRIMHHHPNCIYKYIVCICLNIHPTPHIPPLCKIGPRTRQFNGSDNNSGSISNLQAETAKLEGHVSWMVRSSSAACHNYPNTTP